MPDSPNKLSQFWQELKRRRVVHVITVYATSAFVIIELVNNMAEPLNLPARLATIVIVVIIGLVVLNIMGGGKQLRAGDIQTLLILPFQNHIRCL